MPHHLNAQVETRLAGKAAKLAELELETGKQRLLTNFSGRESLGAPSYSPDGQRIAFMRKVRGGFDL